MSRTATITRTTKETDIAMTLSLDGSGKSKISTGIGFFDHMLDGFTRHGLFDMKLSVKGDLYVDSHHTIEDTGIVLGNAIREAVGDKKGNATDISFFRWMSAWSCVPSICAEDRIYPLMMYLPYRNAGIWTPKWYVNFSMLFPMRQQ